MFDWCTQRLDVIWGSNKELDKLAVTHDKGKGRIVNGIIAESKAAATVNETTTFERVTEAQAGLVDVCGQDGTRYRVYIDPNVPPVSPRSCVCVAVSYSIFFLSLYCTAAFLREWHPQPLGVPRTKFNLTNHRW